MTTIIAMDDKRILWCLRSSGLQNYSNQQFFKFSCHIHLAPNFFGRIHAKFSQFLECWKRPTIFIIIDIAWRIMTKDQIHSITIWNSMFYIWFGDENARWPYKKTWGKKTTLKIECNSFDHSYVHTHYACIQLLLQIMTTIFRILECKIYCWKGLKISFQGYITHPKILKIAIVNCKRSWLHV